MQNKSKPSHITKGSVFADLGFSPERASAMEVKATLYRAVERRARKYSQKQLQEILDEPQPRVSELLNGKVSKVSIEKLLVYAERLGAHAKLVVTDRRRTKSGSLSSSFSGVALAAAAAGAR